MLLARTQVKSWGWRQWQLTGSPGKAGTTLLLVFLLCTCGRAQETVWLSQHARASLDTIGAGFTDWQRRTRELHESNLIAAAERRLEQQRLADKANALRKEVYRYIDAYGFPGKPPIDPDLSAAKQALFKQLFSLPPADSVKRQELLEELALLNAPSWERQQAQQAFITLLNQEADFDQRCMMIPILRTEYEKETFDAYQMMLFLEATYQILHDGEQLEFAPGTHSSHKLTTYIAELDGCW